MLGECEMTHDEWVADHMAKREWGVPGTVHDDSNLYISACIVWIFNNPSWSVIFHKDGRVTVDYIGMPMEGL